jgi:hypothetical protein
VFLEKDVARHARNCRKMRASKWPPDATSRERVKLFLPSHHYPIGPQRQGTVSPMDTSATIALTTFQDRGASYA